MTSVYKKSVILFFTAIIVRIVFHYFTGFTADDAFITFRYAENLASGEGYVYNISQPVFGSSTPLFVLILSLFSLMSVSPIKASFIVSLAASGFTALLLYRFAHHLRFAKFSVLPSLLYIFFPRVIPAETSGMETALFTFFIVASFYLNRKNKNFYALAMATLACLTRYEGFLVLLLILVHVIYKDRDKFLYYLSIPSIIIIPWFLFSFYYFGSIIPHSVTAKLALYNLIGNSSCLDHFVYLMAFHNPVGYFLLIGSIFGAVWLNKKQNFGWLEIFWIVGVILFYTFSKTHLFFWYVAPIYPLYLLFFSGAFVSLFDRFKFLQHKKN
ncbi:MAG: hypothetical protein U9N54_12410, partial [candidate division Zixibacteria bacterium]|nr:hypothetical protein [candidate division Zixibacteria bacterium]